STGTTDVAVTNTDTQYGTKSGAFLYAEAVSIVLPANLSMRYEADNISQFDGTLVTQWDDQSGNARHLTQSNIAEKPTFLTNQINSKPAVRFSAAQFLSTNTNFSFSSSTSFYVVRNNDGHSGGLGTVGELADNGINAFQIWPTSGDIMFGRYTVSSVTWSGYWSNLINYYLFAIVINATGSGKTVKMYRNGEYIGTGPNTVDIQSSSDKYVMGATSSGLYNFDGWVASALIYNTALSDTNRMAIESSLNNKYALYSANIRALSPWSGTTPGGTTLTITGNNFFQGLTVKIGTTNCTETKYINQTKALCTTPAKAAGVYDVTITNPGGTAVTTKNAYSYQASALPDPSDLSPEIWLQASANSYADNDPVYNWTGSDINNYTFRQYILAGRPTFKTSIVNSKSVMRFSAAQSLGDVAPSTHVFPNTTCIVAQNGDTHAGGLGTLLSLSSSGKNSFQVWQTTGNWMIGEYSVSTSTWETLWPTSDFHIACAVASTSGTGQNIYSYFDGKYIREGSSTLDLTGTKNKITIGMSSNGTYNWQGDIAEIIVFNKALTNTELDQLERYFSAKYAVIPLQIESVNKTYLDTAGGQTIDIMVSGAEPDTTVKIAGTPCATTTYASSKQLTCTTPALAAGSKTLTIEKANGQSASINNLLVYQPTASLITNPYDISGNVLLVKADSTSYVDNKKIAFMKSADPNKFLFRQPEDAKRPILKTATANGWPVMRFTAANITSLKDVTPGTNVYPLTSCAIIKNGDIHSGGLGAFLTLSASPQNAMYFWQTTGDFMFGEYSVSTSTWGTRFKEFTKFHLSCVTGSGSGAGQTVNAYFDGTYIGIGDGAVTATGTTDFTIGALNAGSPYNIEGDIAEVFVYNRALIASELDKLLYYAKLKYNINGLQIDSVSHKFVSDAGGTTITVRGSGFDPNITATIGTSSCSSLTLTNSNEFTCVTPAHAVGNTNLNVTDGQGNIATLTDGITYQASGSVNKNPKELSNLIVWLSLDSTTRYSNGDPIAQLRDGSNYDFLFTQYNDAGRPGFATNSGGLGTWFTLTAGNKNAFYTWQTTGDTMFGEYGVNTYIWGGTWANLTNYHYATLVIPTRGTNETIKLYFDGVAQADGTATSSGPIDDLKLCNSSSYALNGKIAEFILYGAALSDADRTAIEAYIKTKYGL
ncbi:MAG: IPT/TIG domain-containing protein, partial [Deltaproteobacteria bacterium]|nr:IPT/TIG domain-containing protein [Deltaproteobacteria bacterium]